MLHFWWDKEDIVYCELLPRDVTITAEIYGQQPRRLRRLETVVQEKGLGRHHRLMLQHDNTCPHTANITENGYSRAQLLESDSTFVQFP